MSDKAVQAISSALLSNGWTDPQQCDYRPTVDAILAALKSARIAVVELPARDEIDADGQEWFSDYDIRVDNTGRDKPGDIITDFGMGSEFRATPSVQRCRRFAAALLAAADAAEGAQS